MLSTAHFTQNLMKGGQLNNELETMSKEAVTAESHMLEFANTDSTNVTKRP